LKNYHAISFGQMTCHTSHSILTVKKPLNYKRVKVEKDRTENVLGFWPKTKTAPKMKFHEWLQYSYLKAGLSWLMNHCCDSRCCTRYRS